MKIADIHAHIFPEKLAEKASHSIGSFYGVSIEREADMPRLCAEDKLAGITRCVVSNSATNASQVQNANTFLAEAVRGHDGYLAFGTIYPGMAAHLGDAIYEEKLVVEDGLITTAEGPAAVLPYSYRLVSYFRGDEAAQSIAKGMVYDRLLREG